MSEHVKDARLEAGSSPAAPPDARPPGRRVAYLINQYPKISHSFIRREIAAVETAGLTVKRIALRGWDETLVDQRDVAERDRTTYLLQNGLLPLLSATARTLFRRPIPFARALGAALGMSVKSTASLPYHLVYLAHACRILELLNDDPVDHLHAHFGTNSAEVALLLRLLGGPPYSFTVHGADEADDGKYLHLDAKVRHATFVAAVSAYTRAQLLRHIAPGDWPKVAVVHCGLEDDAFALPELVAAPVFLSVGRLSSEKGHLVLLEAFAKVALNDPGARLVLAGDGPLRALLEQRIADLNLASRVRITGWISSDVVRREIIGARVLVQPSLQEGLPVVLMEAMALGRPVISTYVAGIPELVTPAVGWLVPAGDAEALREAMEQSLRLPEADVRRMADAAHRRARERHSIATEARKLVALFQKRSV